MLDFKIAGGQVLDGTGSPAVRADVGVERGRIAAVGDLARAEARQAVDAAGCLVLPGFIDAHSHSDARLLVEPSAPSKLFQGVTTEVVGNCGASAAPLRPGVPLPSDWRDLPFPGSWDSTASYCRLLRSVRPGPNVVVLAGHGKLRACVMGYAARPASAGERQAMERLFEQCLDEGARGFSTGLIYAPGLFAEPEEILGLARVAAARGAIYTTHMRSEGAGLLEAIDEALDVARRTGVRLQISHLKTSGRANWHKVGPALEAIRCARAAGAEAAADRYPYTASCTDLDVVLPAWAQEGGAGAVLRRLRDPKDRARLARELAHGRLAADWGAIRIGFSSEPAWRGRLLDEIAGSMEVDRVEAALRIMDRDALRTGAFFFGMDEGNLGRILAEPYVMIGSDASLQAPEGPLAGSYPHPRAYGTFPRFLRAALEGKTVALPDAVRKMTSLPADQFRLAGRGRIAAGAWADLGVWDPGAVADPADYDAPHRLARGLKALLVNGVLTLAENGLTGRRAGCLL